MKSEQERYAELIISMSTDFLLGKIEFSHYATTIDLINTNLKKIVLLKILKRKRTSGANQQIKEDA